ncbi:hypothetical protein JTE90_014619 [Oedothorax gibbosus]|uniref:G-protein coupled receptors family 1 profile domain-containing protein n=1 Tax=Oedothorax gibbosus TaxID=931172 RepID=A0AAV6V827_9ARAC|nr:hypothetical protein JTE90_014619 [Oedothorax gibbosus]
MGEDGVADFSQFTEDLEFLINSTAETDTSTAIDIPVTEVNFLITNLSPTEEIFHYFQISFLVLVTGIGFISNALVLLLFYKRPTLRTFSNRFVLNLSISHLLQSILILPAITVTIATEDWLLGDVTCAVSGFLFTTLNITSVLSLLLIALDRNCAVNSPLHYSMTITKKRTGFMISLTWFIGVIVGTPPFFGISHFNFRSKWHMCTQAWLRNDPYNFAYASVLVVLGFMVPFLTTICVYSSMFQAARDNSERARKHSVNSTSVDTTVPDTQFKTQSSVVSQKKKYRRWSSGSNQFFGEEWKAVRTGVLVVMTFTLCWLPYFTVISMEAFFDISNLIPDYAMFIMIACSSSACIINPYLYVFRNKTSRKHVKQLLCPSNLNKNKRWVFHSASKDKCIQSGVNPCILSASIENESSEKVKALPALYQDIDGHWQIFNTSEDHSREELDETISNVSDDDFFDSKPISANRRNLNPKSSSNVHAIYNNSYNKNFILKSMSHAVQPNAPSSKLILFRLKSSLNRDSTSSDTTENCSISLESTNSNDHQQHTSESDPSLPTRRGIGKYLFNTSEELWESRPSVTYHKRVSTVPEDSTSSSESGRKNLSSFGSARRKSFIHSHMKNKKSNETTLTSSTTSDETLESSSTTSKAAKSTTVRRPKLVRQAETIQPADDYEAK